MSLRRSSSGCLEMGGMEAYGSTVAARAMSLTGNALLTTVQGCEGVGLGMLFCTVKYDFDKTALVCTINRCVNLPAKDSSSKSRYVRNVLK